MSAPREYDLSTVAPLAVRETRAARWVAYLFAGLLWGLSAAGVAVRLLYFSGKFPNGPEGLAFFGFVFVGGFILFGLGLYSRRWGPTHLVVSVSGIELSDGPGRRFAVKWPSGRWPFTVVDYRQAPVANRDPPGQFNRGFRCVPLTSEALEGILASARESGLKIDDERIDATKNSQDPGIHLYHIIRRPIPR